MTDPDGTTTWKPLPPEMEARLESVISSWVGTPYLSGNRVKGMGVDCVQLVAGILDEFLEREDRTPVPRLPPDTGTHSTETAYRTVRALVTAYGGKEVEDGSLQPGDVVVARNSPGSRRGADNMGHCAVVTSIPSCCVHASHQAGVVRTGLKEFSLVRIFRSSEII